MPGGVNGKLALRTFVDRHGSGERVRAVLKPITGGGAQELFAFEAARAMNIEHLVPVVGRRADGTAAIELRRGKEWFDAGIETGADLERAFRQLQRDQAGAPTSSVGKFARRQAPEYLDQVLGRIDDVVRTDVLRFIG